MMVTEGLQLTQEEKDLLLEVLFRQRYASELVSCELVDIERGEKIVDEEKIKKLNRLFERLYQAGV